MRSSDAGWCRRERLPLRATAIALAALGVAGGCRLGAKDEGAKDPATAPATRAETPKPALKTIEERSERSDGPPPAQPVPLWEGGKVARIVDAAAASLHGYVIVDLGEAWVPYIFTDGVSPEGKPLSNSYRETYLALARGDFPDNQQGERAREDKYLELYGIMPTLGQLRKRFEQTKALTCAAELDLQPLIAFQDVAVHESNEAAYKLASDYVYLRGQVERMQKEQKVAAPEQLALDSLEDRDRDRLKRFLKIAPEYLAVDAAQKRLKCEGFLRGKTRYVRGALDWATRDALAEYERRHRVYSWGYLGRDTLAVLRVMPVEAERRALVRILTERAIHAAGVLEDGTTSAQDDGQARTYPSADGKARPIPNLAGELERRLVEAFGLQTPESAYAFLERLGALKSDEHVLVAIKGPELPEYYDGDMALTVEYDRGDVWYDFPFNDQGQPLPQAVARRPYATVYTEHLGQKVPLARMGTTIGGWRTEQVGEATMWRYKESPVGPRVWTEIVASPVWLPPDSTPPRELLKKRKERKQGEPVYELNYHETGPSYASAYGLVAAYHREYFQRADGSIALGRDEGIRTHGSVDYMSIMRRHSHGCHRLHNHMAVRLMSFVLAHRPHKRLGQESLVWKKMVAYEDEQYLMDIREGGYAFELNEPLRIGVAEGRVRGQVKKPIEFPIPKWDELYGAYVTPEGAAVQVRGDRLIEVPLPQPDGGIPDVLEGMLPSTGALLGRGGAGAPNPFSRPPPPMVYEPKPPPISLPEPPR